MNVTPSQQWSSAVHELFACARGRLPAAFLERKLADIGLVDVRPLLRDDLPRLERAVDVVNALVSGTPIPGGKKPDEAMADAFPEDHPTLGKLRAVAMAHVATMRPTKANKAARQPELPAAAPVRGNDRNYDRPADNRSRNVDRGAMDRGNSDRGNADRGNRQAPRGDAPRMPPVPMTKISWEQWLERRLGARAAVAPKVDAPSEGSGAAPAAQTQASTLSLLVPQNLVHWQINAESTQQLTRIRDRVDAIVAAQADSGADVRELVQLILRIPLAVRDDVRGLIAEYYQTKGLKLSLSSLSPPPPVAAMKRDWENLLAACGPSDPAVEACWKKIIDAHPEAKAALEAERAQELDELSRRLVVALRELGEEDHRTRDIRTRMETRHANVAERIEAEVTKHRAALEAASNAGRLVAERSWEDPEVSAALLALDAHARQRFDKQRRHEFEEIDRRLRSAAREQGPSGEATRAALERMRERFPTEGAAAAARLDHARRGEGLAQQESALQEAGRSLSSVHLASTVHRITHLRPAPRWRLVISVVGDRSTDRTGSAPKKDIKSTKDAKDSKPSPEHAGVRQRRQGHAVGWLISGNCEYGPVPATWRAADCGNLEEFDACVQALLDRDGGIIGIPLSECPERGGGAWADAAWTLAALAAFSIPVESLGEIAVELPSWASVNSGYALAHDLAALSGPTSLPDSKRSVVFADSTSDHAASVIEALAWSWDGKKDSDQARMRQSGLLGTCLLQPSVVLRETVMALCAGSIPAWPVWSDMLQQAIAEPGGLADALMQRVRVAVMASPESITALHRHLTGSTRSRVAESARYVHELLWLDSVATSLRPRDRLRLDVSLLAAQAAAGRIETVLVERLSTELSTWREDWPVEVLEAALHAAAYARDIFDTETADSLLAPWAKADALDCGGRAMYVRLCEERARISAGAGRWKDARKHLTKALDAVQRCADPADRAVMRIRPSTLLASIMTDDHSVADDDTRTTLITALNGSDPRDAALVLATQGNPRHAHHAVLRWAICRHQESVTEAYLSKRESWCDPKDPSGMIVAMRAILLASSDPDTARALLLEAIERSGGDAATPVQRLSLLACAVAAELKGAALPRLRERLTQLGRDRSAAAPAVAALEKALTMTVDVRAGLAEALPMIVR